MGHAKWEELFENLLGTMYLTNWTTMKGVHDVTPHEQDLSHVKVFSSIAYITF